METNDDNSGMLHSTGMTETNRLYGRRSRGSPGFMESDKATDDGGRHWWIPIVVAVITALGGIGAAVTTAVVAAMLT